LSGIWETGRDSDDIAIRGLSEGWGDVLASLASDQPLLGEGFRGSGTIVRTADNNFQYPASGIDAIHNLGQAWAGFTWHLRENLINSLGSSNGKNMTNDLVIPVFLANSPDIPSALTQVLLRDDNDGNLFNGVPHKDEILRAANRHSLPPIPRLLDVDGNGISEPFKDGYAILLYAAGFRGNDLNNFVGSNCLRCTGSELDSYITGFLPSFDIDRNGATSAFTDGILIIRYLLGSRGNALINSAVMPDATRSTAAEIENYLQLLSQ